jgi:hypothetical protein
MSVLLTAKIFCKTLDNGGKDMLYLNRQNESFLIPNGGKQNGGKDAENPGVFSGDPAQI